MPSPIAATSAARMDFARRLRTKGEHRVGSFLSIGRNPVHAHTHLLRADNTRTCRDWQIAASNKQSPNLSPHFVFPQAPAHVIAGSRSFLFFPGIEADCGTEPLDGSDADRSSIAKKFAAYRAIAEQGTGCTEGAEGGRQKSRPLSDAPLANSVAICGVGIADPCVSGKPLVRGPARWTKRATEENGHRGKSRTLNVYARRDGLPCLGATNHD